MEERIEEGIEERVSRRGLILGILVVCAVLGLAIWGGSLVGTSRAKQQQQETQGQLTSARTEVSQMQSSYTNLQRDNVTLRTQLMSTESALSQMQASYVGLQQDNAKFQGQLTSTESALSQMQSSYSSFQQDNTRLRVQLASLTSEHDSLKMRYGALERTKWFVVDGRLQVRLSTEVQFAAVTWVRGEVTNIGSSTVQKVYILVSRYKPDGSLDKLDLPPTVILNLAPGGVGYFSFLTAGETCKVTVLGDY